MLIGIKAESRRIAAVANFWGKPCLYKALLCRNKARILRGGKAVLFLRGAVGNGEMRENSAEIKARQPRGGNSILNTRKGIITAARAAIHQRVQRLIDLGVIVGSGYHVNPKSLGYRTCTYVGIKLEKGSMYKTVVAELGKIPEIVECHFTTGPYTMLTKVYARDNEHLMDLLNNKMQEIPGVTATETLISLEQSIKKEIPICPEK